MPETRPLGFRANARYRVVAEARIVDLLLLHSCAGECTHDERNAAAEDAAAALNRWVRMGLPYATAESGERRFDPAEVVNFLRWANLAHGDPFWENRCIATSRKLILDFHRSATPHAPPPIDALRPRRFSVTLRREFNLGNTQLGKRILLRLPLPIEDHALRDLGVTPWAPAGLEVEFEMGPARLDARLAAPRQRTLVLGVEALFTAAPTIGSTCESALDPAERDLYTRPSEGIVQVSPRVRRLAADLADASDDAWGAVRRFWDFILDNLTCGFMHYDQLDAARPTDGPLESGWFDCHLGSALLVALCRARGIPARLVSGYPAYATNVSLHYWAEIWIDARGWMPFDLICSDLSVGGRDRSWRDYFFGALDYRMKTQCLPRVFNLAPSVRFPPVWHTILRGDGEGTELTAFATDSGELVYRDYVSVRQLGAFAASTSADSVNAAPL
jgi:hypothetical protein